MNPEDYEELKKRNEEREKEERTAIEQMLERQKKEQEELKKRDQERAEEEQSAIERIKEREIKEQKEFNEIKKQKEKEEIAAEERVAEEERDAVEQSKEREKTEQKEIKEISEKREREEKAAETDLKNREIKEKQQRKSSEENERREISEPIKKQQSEKLFASLLPPTGSTDVNTHSGTLPVFYVIIGRGPAAVINHTTLRQTEFGKKRIAGLPVMHIGFANPWTKYMHHGMGQPPHLLNLPGFENQPGHLLKDEGLDSREFARCVEDEYKRLESRYGAEKVVASETWVVWIQTKGLEKLGAGSVKIKDELIKDEMSEEFIGKIEEKLSTKFLSETAALRLLVMNAKPANQLEDEDIFFIYASYVDICTGPGRPNVLPPIKGDTEECKNARTAAWLSPEKWRDQWGYELKHRKVLNGVEAIRDEVSWTAGERVCVTAGGGVGLNAAERARNDNCKLDWFARTSLMDTFANPRNDTILRHPTEDRLLSPGESKILKWVKDDHIIPCNEKLRYGYGASLENTGMFGSKVEVSLVGNEKSKIKDYFNQQVGFYSESMWDCSSEYSVRCSQLPSKFYDRLVIPNGQASRSLGHAYFFVRHLTLSPLVTPDGQMIGLKTADEKVRVLGAAAQTYDKYSIAERNTTDEAGKKMWLSWDSLPVSAVPDGFIFSGINITAANKFFEDKKHNNVNTASQDELDKILTSKFGSSDAQLIAEIIVEKRQRPNCNGYENILQVIDALRSNQKTKEISWLASIAELLNVGYTKSKGDDLLDDD